MYIYWRRKQGVSKGAYPLGSGFPIGASSIPVGTRFSAGKSEDNTNITLGDAEKKKTSVYAIAVNPDKLTFGAVNEGYIQPGERTVTITNTGNRSVTLHQLTGNDASARILLFLLIISLGGLFTAVWYKMKKRKRQ